MDICEDAHKTVLDRLRKEELAVPDADYEGQDHLIKFGDVHCTSEPPERTDGPESCSCRLPVESSEGIGPLGENSRRKRCVISYRKHKRLPPVQR